MKYIFLIGTLLLGIVLTSCVFDSIDYSPDYCWPKPTSMRAEKVLSLISEDSNCNDFELLSCQVQEDIVTGNFTVGVNNPIGAECPRICEVSRDGSSAIVELC